MPRFSPAFGRTLRPGFSRLPVADRVMLPIRRSSTRITSNRRTMPVLAFSAQSLRRSVSRARSRAIACLTRPRRFEPRFARASLRCRRRSLLRSRPVRAGQCSISPVDKAAETATPRSMPAAWPLPGAGTGAGITAKATCHRPGAVHRHPVGLRARRHRAGPAEPDPSGLGPPDLAGLPADTRRTSHCRRPPDDPESLIQAGLAPRRPPGRVAPDQRTRPSPGRSPAAPAAARSGSQRPATDTPLAPG